MADVGRSTTSHVKEQSQEARVVENMLVNWGDWLASLASADPAEYALQPMFKHYKSGYRKSASRPAASDPDLAEIIDKILAQLPVRDQLCLRCHYEAKLSSRKAASLLTNIEKSELKQYKGHKLACSNRTYTSWLSEAIANAEVLLLFAITWK